MRDGLAQHQQRSFTLSKTNKGKKKENSINLFSFEIKKPNHPSTKFLKMKIIFFVLCIFSFGTMNAQKAKKLVLCSTKFTAPAGCTTDSKESLKCTDYSMFWEYLDQDMIRLVTYKYLDILSKGFKNFKKESTECYLLHQKVDCYIVSYENGQSNDYLIIAYGTVNNESVVFHLNSFREIRTNADLPEFAKQIFQFGE
jgi:hypothetical protein